ncbi:unnamed protein product [Alopecurus aequalis]
MGAVLSVTAAALLASTVLLAAVYLAASATKNYARRQLMAQDAEAADWSGLPEDLLLIVMAALDVPSLARSGAVCKAWRDACNTFRLPALKQAPCLLYACDEYGPNDGALYCPSMDAMFRVLFPGPPHDKRGFVFSCHGVVFAADEAGNPYLFNPITGDQAVLPPFNTLRSICDDSCGNYFDDDGKHVKEAVPDDPSFRPGVFWARHKEYIRVAISPAANDGLFYIQHSQGSICTLDLSGPSPSMTMIMGPVVTRSLFHLYLALTPSGELLQVWRMRDYISNPLKSRLTRQDIATYILEDCVHFANEDVSDEEHIGQGRNNNEEDEVDGAEPDEFQIEQVSTTELLVFKVDTDRQELVELRDIGEHALFLGCNAPVCLSTQEFSPLEPNCIYLTDDAHAEYHPVYLKDLHIWNIKKRRLQNLGDAWPNVHSWLDIPAPIWITPRF